MRSTIRKGSKGNDVRFCQTRLNHHGHTVDADGHFGAGTRSAVMQFQASRLLTPDGIVGKGTWTHLESDSNSCSKDIGDINARKATARGHGSKIPKGVSDARRRVLKVALSDLGADEIPDGSNWGKEILHLVEGYNEFWRISGGGHFSWCAMACSSWIGIGLGLSTRSADMPWKRHPFGAFMGGASQLEKWGKENGHWVEETKEAPAASIFAMARGGSSSDPAQTAKAGHVGMVICDNGNGTITTIEGNVSNGVRSHVRKKKDLHGFITWWKTE